MTRFSILFLFVTVAGAAQPSDWIKKPREEWPAIAMVNEVWYANGERYVHPSFDYAATGFLIDTGTDTLAATVKHVLWIAKTKTMNFVYVKDELARWIMHPKGNLKDSVVIDTLINSDATEMLKGTITQRDWLVFTTRYVSPHIQPLKPRYTTLEVGEKIYFFGCPYKDSRCITKEARVLEVEGNRIVFTRPEMELGGASGSALVDENGFLVGILSGSAVTRVTGEAALSGTSTHYLRKILTGAKPLNVPLIPVGEVLAPIITTKGIRSGLKKFQDLKKEKTNFFRYDFSAEALNAVADRFLENRKTDWAIELYLLSIREVPLSGTYTKLARAYVDKGDKPRATEAYRSALKLWPENKEASEELRKIVPEDR